MTGGGRVHLRDVLGQPECGFRGAGVSVVRDTASVTCANCRRTGNFTRRQMDERRF